MVYSAARDKNKLQKNAAANNNPEIDEAKDKNTGGLKIGNEQVENELLQQAQADTEREAAQQDPFDP